MIREPLAETKTPLARVDARFRVVLAVGFSVVVALSRCVQVQTAALGLAGALYLGGRLPVRILGNRLMMVNGFIAFLWLVLPFSVPGQVVAMGFLHVSVPGIMHALQITLKANAIIIANMALVATMTVPFLGNTLQSLGIPPKMCQLLLMTYRYIFVFEEESRRMYRAAVLRGFTPTTSMHTYRTYASMVGMVLVRAWERARRVRDAMICRGFRGRVYTLATYDAVAGDWVFFACGTVVIVALGVLELVCAS